MNPWNPSKQDSPAAAGQFTVSTAPESAPICTIPVSPCREKTWFQAPAADLSGEHALYFTFHGPGIAALHKIRLRCA